MLLRIYWVLLSLFSFSLANAASVGQPAPDFSLTDSQGMVVRLSHFRNRFVVLEWVNPACPFVQKHYRSGNMQTLQKEAVTNGVVWLSINSTEPEHIDYMSPPQMKRWMSANNGAASHILHDEDGRVGQAYGARVTPHMYIVDPKGRLVYAGGIDSIPSSRVDDIPRATNFVRQGLAESLAGKPVTTATSRAYGCSIKYKS